MVTMHLILVLAGPTNTLRIIRSLVRSTVAVGLFVVSWSTQAQIGVYQSAQQFLDETFPHGYQADTYWLKDGARKKLEQSLGHAYPALRIRFWHHGDRTAWILNEIGKEMPITTGIVVEGERIVAINVLEYRESRGGEVRHGFFRNQFLGATRGEKSGLDRHIQGITGATLSVQAMRRMATAALQLHESSQLNKSQLAESSN